MSKNENEVRNVLQQDATSLSQNAFVQAGIKTIATSVSVATALYPLDIIKTRLQINGSSGFSFSNPFMFSYKTLQPLINNFFSTHGNTLLSGYITANKGSLVKNTVITNRDTVDTRVETIIGDKSADAAGANQHQKILLSSGIITIIDTSLTQWFSNLRVLNALNIKPVITSKLQFLRNGITIRGTNNFLTTLACISTTTILSDYLNPFISRANNALLHNGIVSSVAGFGIAPLVNSFDVIYKIAISRINLQTMEIPRYRDIATELFKKEGTRPFFRGALLSGISSTTAFCVINAVSAALEPAQPKITTNKNTFFAPKAPQTLEAPSTQEATQEAPQNITPK